MSDEHNCIKLVVIADRIPLDAQEVVYVTEALATFASEHLNADVPSEPAWYPVEQICVPAWLLKSRRHRWAYLTGCCELNLDSFTAEVPNSAASVGGGE